MTELVVAALNNMGACDGLVPQATYLVPRYEPFTHDFRVQYETAPSLCSAFTDAPIGNSHVLSRYVALVQDLLVLFTESLCLYKY